MRFASCLRTDIDWGVGEELLLPKLILGVSIRFLSEATLTEPEPAVDPVHPLLLRRGRLASDPMVSHSPSSLAPPLVVRLTGVGAGSLGSGAALGALRPRYSGSEPIVDWISSSISSAWAVGSGLVW